MKKIFSLFLLIVFFTLVSCGQIEQNPTPPDKTLGGGDIPTVDDPITNPDVPTINEEVEFVVSLIYNKKVFIPSESISVIWADDYSKHTEVIGSDGYAKKKLDGDFNVYLKNCPSGYTYNPNIYQADNENPVVEIELLKIGKLRGAGALGDEVTISSTGTYVATLKSANKKMFYSFEPKQSGYYVIESIVNVYEDNVNPKLDSYNGNAGGTRYYDKTYNTGGKSLKGGYTKNFKYEIKLSDDQTAGVFFIFGIYAESKTGVYPVDVGFTITYYSDYYREDIVSKLMVAEEANFKTPEYPSSKYTYFNSDHGVGSYYNSVTNGSGLLNGKNYAYNEETGYWHLYDQSTNTYGPILCAKISKPCAYYEESLNMIESHGNKNLTVSNGTENYKQFIEVSYTSACNSDGVCYVTMELKEFLQKFSVSQRLFFDGNGFVESTGVYAIEEDQWLFACGYYQEK